MKAATGRYSKEAKSLLKGKITLYNYSKDVQTVLARRQQIAYSGDYIRYVVHLEKNQDAIWDAITQVLTERKRAKADEQSLTRAIKELVEVD